MQENENNQQTSFIDFMASKKDGNENSKNNQLYSQSKTKDALNKEREKEKEEKNKELKEAKSNSIALANRYNKSYMIKAQTKNFIIMIPFIILGAFIFLILLFNGGTWLNRIINWFFNSLING